VLGKAFDAATSARFDAEHPDAPQIGVDAGTDRAIGFMSALLDEGGDGLEQLIAFAAPHNITGSPTLSLPGGIDEDGVPYGFQLVGAHGSEATLLRAGHAFQQQTAWHARHPEE